MAQIVKLRRSSVSGQKPTNSNLQLGELALNTTDGKVYMAVSGSLGPTVEELISTNTVNTGSIHLVGAITASNISGSYIGDGTGLYNIPASGVTGLELFKIVSGSVSASISPNRGFEVNTDTTITGSVNVSGSINLSGDVTSSNVSSSFIGDGHRLYNIPLSGVTDLVAVSGSIDSRLDVLEAYSGSQLVPSSSMSFRTLQTDVYCKNVTGQQINKGTVVRIVGATGDNPLIGPADLLTEGNSANTLGIATENIPNDSFGLIITEGILTGVNTNGMTAGALLFLGANGTFTTTAPAAPNHGVRLGEVLRVQQNNGSIYVRIDNGIELNEAHDVIYTGITTGDLLIRSGSVWKNGKTLNGNYTVTGSLTITQNLTVLGSSSIVYSTASQLIVEDNKIILNASYPAERFAGIEVHDSGSNGSVTASLFWDGQNNRWIYQNSSEAHYGGAMFIAGPRNTGSLGDEQTLTNGRIPKSIGGDHIGDSIISETGSTITVSGSLIANSITGSLSGDATGLINVPFHITGSDVDGNTYDKQFSKLQFDDSTGLNVSESVAGTAFISIGSHFRDIFVSGSTMLRATGSDAFEVIGQDGIGITTSITDTNSNGYIKELKINATSLSSSLNDRIDIVTGSVDALNTFSSSVVLTSETASMTVLSASYALTAAFALNAGGGGEGKTYIHNQTSASTTWTVTHNLGERYPSIEVFDSNGYVVIPGDILAQNDNTLVVTFPSAQSGKVSVTVGGGLPYISGSYVEYVLATDGDSPRWKGGIISGSQQITNFGFATTGSNIFYGNQTISGTTTIGVATMGSKCVTISSNTSLFDLGTFDGANFDYVVKSGNNMRAGLIMSAWNGTNSVYNESSTMDLGSTTGVTFSVSNAGVLNANISSGTWAVEVLYRALGCSEITPPTSTSTPTPTPTPTVTPTPTPTPTNNPNAGTWDLYMKSQTLVTNPNYSDFDLFWKEGNGSWIRHIENTHPQSTTYVLQFPDIAVNSGSTVSFALYRNSQPGVPIDFGAGFNGPYTGYCGYDNPYVKTFDGTENQGVYINVAVVSDDLVTCGATNYMISTGSTAPDYCSGLFGSDISVYGNSSDWLTVTRFFTDSNLTTPFNGGNKYYGNSTADYGTTLRIDSSGWVFDNYAC